MKGELTAPFLLCWGDTQTPYLPRYFRQTAAFLNPEASARRRDESPVHLVRERITIELSQVVPWN